MTVKKVEIGMCGFDNFEAYQKWFYDGYAHSIDNGIYFNEKGMAAINRLGEIISSGWGSIEAVLDVAAWTHFKVDFVDRIHERIYGKNMSTLKEEVDAAIQLLSEIFDYKRPE